MNFSRTLFLVTIFAIAMGFLETAVVVYLRELLYSGSFSFPVKPASHRVLYTELGRELATIVMLAMAGVITGKSPSQRFGYFIYCFAVWDIFYYIFLKLILNWPATLLDWDILFLLPVPWVGPVLAPCLISCTMIAFAFLLLHLEREKRKIQWHPGAWLYVTLGCLALLSSFCTDYVGLLRSNENQATTDMLTMMHSWIPQSYNWSLFGLGEVLICCGMISVYRKSLNSDLTPVKQI